MRYIKVKVSPGEVGFICKIITKYKGKIEMGSPLYLCNDGTVTPVENGAKVIGSYDVSNIDAKEEQPLAGDYPNSEFIKVQRKAVQLAADAYEEEQEWSPTKASRLLDACTRLDRSEAEIKKYIEMDKYKSKQIILGTENYNRICKTVEQLETSRKALLVACERGFNRLLELGQRESMDTPKILKAAINSNKEVCIHHKDTTNNQKSDSNQ